MLLPDSNSCVAYLLRHGATFNNLAKPPILQGSGIDGELSPDGQRQAHEAADCLKNQPLDAVYSSPLRRAHETADAIAQHHPVVLKLIPEITEVDVGEWESRSWVEIRESEPERYQQFQSDPAQCGYRGGENLAQVADRVIPALEATMQAHLGQAIAIVGHNVVNRVYLAHALGLPLALARQINQHNCGINVLQYRTVGTKVVAINSFFHLTDA